MSKPESWKTNQGSGAPVHYKSGIPEIKEPLVKGEENKKTEAAAKGKTSQTFRGVQNEKVLQLLYFSRWSMDPIKKLKRLFHNFIISDWYPDPTKT